MSGSRREFLETGAALIGATAMGLFGATPANAQTSGLESSGSSGAEQLSSADQPYKPVRVLDTEKLPVEGFGGAPSMSGWGRKTLFYDPSTQDRLSILYTPPGGQGAPVHYHTFHEWAYNIKGDFTNNESTCPEDRSGPYQRFREGNFLDRPPHSLHGGERGREPWMASQVGSIILIMEEGGESYTIQKNEGSLYDYDMTIPAPGSPAPTVNSKTPIAGGMGMHYGPTSDPNFKDIKQWAIPRIIDTIDKLPYQPDPGVPGLGIKWLANDQSRGFRVVIRYLPPGWKSSLAPQFARAYYYKQAHQFNWVIAGELNIQTYKSPGEKGETYVVKQHFMVERPPMSIFGLAEGNVTNSAVVWLEATYAKGTHIPHIPIEEKTYV